MTLVFEWHNFFFPITWIPYNFSIYYLSSNIIKNVHHKYYATLDECFNTQVID